MRVQKRHAGRNMQIIQLASIAVPGKRTICKWIFPSREHIASQLHGRRATTSQTKQYFSNFIELGCVSEKFSHSP